MLIRLVDQPRTCNLPRNLTKINARPPCPQAAFRHAFVSAYAHPQPLRLGHARLFAGCSASTDFAISALEMGLRIDRGCDRILLRAGRDHHVLAFAKSPGLAYYAASGEGSMRSDRAAGYCSPRRARATGASAGTRSANFFHYIQDPQVHGSGSYSDAVHIEDHSCGPRPTTRLKTASPIGAPRCRRISSTIMKRKNCRFSKSPELSKIWRPLRESNPCFSRERAETYEVLAFRRLATNNRKLNIFGLFRILHSCLTSEVPQWILEIYWGSSKVDSNGAGC